MLAVLNTIIYSYIFILGICIGSFLNVVIYRVPNKISLVKGRSFCPNCKQQIKNYDLIPVFSYIFLLGKCRTCKKPISPRYFIIELITGLFAMFVYYYSGYSFITLCLFFLFSILLCVTMIDFDTLTIPNGLIISLAVLAVPFAILQTDISLLDRVIGFFAISLPMYILCKFIEDAFGGGDIKLVAVCGFIIGYQNIIFSMIIASIIAGIYGSYLLTTKKTEKNTHICFGPYLSIAIMFSSMFGTKVIDWYLNLFI